jgi:3-hydroxymyristoyl/3-hydroxydecanoyl-(acyl carrier protein) dehydratase
MTSTDDSGAFPWATPMGREEIQRFMPHGENWIMVDHIVECHPPTFIRTRKYVDDQDPFVAGHFRGRPALLPGVLLVEYVSQSAYLLGRLAGLPSYEAPPVKLLARCSASFLSPAHGGDLLTAEVRLTESIRDVTVHEGVVSCGERVVCRVTIFAAPPSREASLTLVRREGHGRQLPGEIHES